MSIKMKQAKRNTEKNNNNSIVHLCHIWYILFSVDMSLIYYTFAVLLKFDDVAAGTFRPVDILMAK